MDITGFKKILIIKPSSLGDVIHALPVAASLKSGTPDARIDWVVGSPFMDILKGNPDIERLIPFDRGLLKGGHAVGNLKAFLGELRRERYEIVIDLQGLLRSALMAAACRADRRVGFANAREGAPFFYTDKVPVHDANIHAVDRYLLTLRRLGLDITGKPLFRIATGPEDETQADAVMRSAGIAEGEPFVAFAPSARWETKRWPAGNFLELASRLRQEKGLKALFIGSAGDRELFEGLDVSDLEDSFAFGRTTLKGLAALLGRAKVLITNDSGPMHVAAAVGTPCAAFFGPTDPKRTGPYGDGHRIISAGTGCAPCFRRDCKNNKCLTSITVEMAYAEINNILSVVPE